MGKRSNFQRLDKDQYLTIDINASKTLLPHLEGIKSFVEPCVGWGHLVGPFTRAGLECRGRYDVKPKYPGVERKDALALTALDVRDADVIITNPPWTRALLHPMIERFMHLAPTWLLFDADWAYTGQSKHLMKFCTDVIPVGRLNWIVGTTTKGKDNCAWYRFEAGREWETILHLKEAA